MTLGVVPGWLLSILRFGPCTTQDHGL